MICLGTIFNWCTYCISHVLMHYWVSTSSLTSTDASCIVLLSAAPLPSLRCPEAVLVTNDFQQGELPTQLFVRQQCAWQGIEQCTRPQHTVAITLHGVVRKSVKIRSSMAPSSLRRDLNNRLDARIYSLASPAKETISARSRRCQRGQICSPWSRTLLKRNWLTEIARYKYTET